MLKTLDLTKTMVFKDEQPAKTYKEALSELSAEIGLAGDLDLTKLEATIKTAIVEKANALSNSKEDSSADATIVAFHKWVSSIHNNNLGIPQGSRFPNNIVYDMISALRNDKNPQSQDILLRFFLEGLNARKINNGETPSLDFISTSLLLQVLSQLNNESAAARDFVSKYDSISAFVEPQNKLEATMTNLKEDPLFAFLSSEGKNIFNFSKKENTEYGANAYGLEKALSEGISHVESYSADKLLSDNQNMVNKIEMALDSTLPLFQDAISTRPARLLALWDASEWFCRSIVALQVAGKIDQNVQAVAEKRLVDSTLSEIYERSKLGSFPGKARNDDIAKIEITELFQQTAIAAEAKSKAKVRL